MRRGIEDMKVLAGMTIEELEKEKRTTYCRIAELSSSLNSQKERMKWIEKYLFKKTPQKMCVKEIERRLGHKVIIIKDS